MTSPLYSELPQELLLDVEPMRPAGGGVKKRLVDHTEKKKTQFSPLTVKAHFAWITQKGDPRRELNILT